MKSPWTIAFEVDHLRPKDFVLYGKDEQAVRPLKPGDKVFLCTYDTPSYGILRKIKSMMLVNDEYYRIQLERKKTK